MNQEEQVVQEEGVSTPSPVSQPISYARQNRAERLKQAAIEPDFVKQKVYSTDEILKDYVTNLDQSEIDEIVRSSGIKGSLGEQAAVAVQNALMSYNSLTEYNTLSGGNTINYFTGNNIGDEWRDMGYEAMLNRKELMEINEESVGGVRNWLAKLAGGATSMGQMALEGFATAGVLPMAKMALESYGEGTFNDLKKYADEHEGSLEGYEPKGVDLAINTANGFIQAYIERKWGVASPRFLTGWSRGFWKEGVGGIVQEFSQSEAEELAEVAKGNMEVAELLDNVLDNLIDATVAFPLQGALGAISNGQHRKRADAIMARARAISRGAKEPTKEDYDFAKKINDAKERELASALTTEFKSAFDETTGEGKLQKKIAGEIKRAVEAKELDLDTANETELAQRIEQIATQETLTAIEDALEKGESVSELALNNIVYKDGAIWLEGLTPEVGDKSVSYARVLAERQSGLAELQTRIDANTRELQQLKADLAEAKAQKQESRAQVLQARIDKQNAIAEKNRLQAEKLEAQTAKLEKQIAKQTEQVKVAEPIKMAEVKAKKTKPVAERKALKQERIIKNKEQEVKRAEPDSGLVMLNKKQAQQLLKDYQGLLAYKDIDVKKIKNKTEKAKVESAKSRLRDIEYNIEYIKYYAGEESTYQPKDVAEVTTKWKAESPTQQQTETQTELTKSKKRVKESAEVYTPKWVVNEMLDLIPAETWENIDATFLEPAGGNGNFVEEILRRKLAKANTTEEKIRALKSVYAIELMLDNVDEMRTRVKLIMEENGVTEGIDYIIKRNIQQGNFLSKENIFGEDISFYDWVNEGTDTLKDMIARGEQEQAETQTELTKSKKRVKESADTGNILKQGSISGKGDTARGGYDDQLKRIILDEKSDLSTIQHEFAHYWMQNNFKWARSGLASQDWLRKWRDVEEWLGIEPQDRLLSKSASEKFAKAYERYILEGKVAPELQWAFEGFQKAYQDIYSDLENEYFDLEEELASEVVDWFNRNKEQSPKRLLEADTKKIEKQIALSAGASVIEDVNGNVVMTEQNKEGDLVVYMGVKESEIPAGDNLLVQADKTTASKLQQSAKRWLSDKVEVQQLTTLDTQATLNNFKNWIARDRAGAWNSMMNPDTRPIYRTYLYKAFAQEAMNDADLAVELANIDMGQAVREMGQAIQALDIRNESGFDTLEIMRNIEKSKGKMSTEELNKEVESMGLDMIELSQADIDEIEFDTECKL